MPVVSIRFDQIDPNPYRDFVANPPTPDQIDTLKASISLTSFWEGLLVRKHPEHKGRYQLAFGHSRIEAAKLLGIGLASFNLVELDDARMIQLMAMENLAAYGRDEYLLYREVITAAVEYVMDGVVSGTLVPGDQRFPDGFEPEVVNGIKAGGMPGREVVGQFFGGVLGQKGIRMALEEYKDTGKLAAWHRKHNPKASNHVEAPTLNPEALGKFRETAHVKTFADTVRQLGVSVADQPALADAVLTKLKEPEVRRKSPTAENQRLGRQYARTDQPRHERLTSNNIRSTARHEVAKKLSPKEKTRLRVEAAAISIEGAMAEMSIGLRRASAAASDIVRVAEALGGLHVDFTASAQLRLGECRDAIKALERSLKAAAKHGVRIPLIGG